MTLSRKGLVQIAAIIALATALNLAVIAFHLDKSTVRPCEPSGLFVGGVWIALFALMGTARALVPHRALDALIVVCAAYPLIVLPVGNHMDAIAANIFTAVLTVFVVNRLWLASRLAAALIFPTIPWLAYATYVLVQT